MSQIRYWTVQIIFTCAPTVIFILWAMNNVHCMNNLVNRIMDERDDQRRLTDRVKNSPYATDLSCGVTTIWPNLLYLFSKQKIFFCNWYVLALQKTNKDIFFLFLTRRSVFEVKT